MTWICWFSSIFLAVTYLHQKMKSSEMFRNNQVQSFYRSNAESAAFKREVATNPSFGARDLTAI